MRKEIPMLYSTPMVQAILRDVETKTKTRRTTRLDKISPKATEIVRSDQWKKKGDWIARFEIEPGRYEATNIIRCPYGKSGDLLWVRETWASNNLPSLNGGQTFYKADEQYGPYNGMKWKPSIHMPKKAARIWLEVVSVNVERLQNITEEDANAEGVLLMQKDGAGSAYKDYTGKMLCLTSARDSFESLWRSINNDPKKPNTHWDANPWVWVVEFKKVEKP